MKKGKIIFQTLSPNKRKNYKKIPRIKLLISKHGIFNLIDILILLVCLSL
jgi:hypothetical protein